MPAQPATRLVVAIVLVVAGFAASHTATGQTPPDLRVAVFGDFNGPYGSTDYPRLVRTALDVIEGWRPDLLLSPGDVIAGQSPRLTRTDLDALWQVFDRVVAARLRAAGIPYAVSLGNHDASNLRDASGEFSFPHDREAAAAYWGSQQYERNLAYVERSGFPFNYSFVHGRAFIIVLDASSARLGGEQTEWIARQLASEAAVAAAVRIAVGHLPLLPVSRGREQVGEYLLDGARLAAEWSEAGLDLYVSGHHAAYYPGNVAGLEVVFAGGVGGKALLGGQDSARSTVTLVELWFEPLTAAYTTVDLASGERLSELGLPAMIASEAGVVERSRWVQGSVEAVTRP